MKAERFKSIRFESGMSVTEMAELLNLSDPKGAGARRVREMETGGREISGPVARIAHLVEAGVIDDPWTAMGLG